MSSGLDAMLAQLHLGQAAEVLPQWLDRAATEELGYADFLQGLLEEELAARDAAATARRLRDAAFPFAATIEQSGTLWVSASGPTSSARWCSDTSTRPSSSGPARSR